MTINIQQIIYEALKDENFQYQVYTCPCDSMQIPYILINNITTTTLPYAQELYQYQEVDVLITIYDKPYSNNNCLKILEKVKSRLNHSLKTVTNISNLSITTITDHNSKSFSADLKLNFYYIH
jgi:hypothetical protein